MPINSSYKMPQARPGLCKQKVNRVSNTKIKSPQKKRKCPSAANITAHKPITNRQLDYEMARINHISHKENAILRKKKTKSDLAQCFHAACFSPTMPTFAKAIKNNHFAMWPDLTTDLALKCLPKSMLERQERMKSEKQGLQSTTKQLTKEELWFLWKKCRVNSETHVADKSLCNLI